MATVSRSAIVSTITAKDLCAVIEHHHSDQDSVQKQDLTWM